MAFGLINAADFPLIIWGFTDISITLFLSWVIIAVAGCSVDGREPLSADHLMDEPLLLDRARSVVQAARGYLITAILMT